MSKGVCVPAVFRFPLRQRSIFVRILATCGSVVVLFLFLPLPGMTQTPAEIHAPSQHASAEASYSALADPKAVVVAGRARFTVLTPQLFRMEWADDGHFEDRPSMVFLNRRLPVPEFKITRSGKSVTIVTSALRLHYVTQGNKKFV